MFTLYFNFIILLQNNLPGICQLFFFFFSSSVLLKFITFRQEHPARLFSLHFSDRIAPFLSLMGKCEIPPFEKLPVKFCSSLPHLILSMYSFHVFIFHVFIWKFFVEDPRVAREEVLTTGPPEVLVFTSQMNVTNESLKQTQGENSGGNQFYLPVSLALWEEILVFWLCCFSHSTTIKQSIFVTFLLWFLWILIVVLGSELDFHPI